MILIFGGVYQGKLAYASERLALADDDIYRCSIDDVAAPGGKRLIYEIDKWILALVKADSDVTREVRSFIAENEDVAVICNDISCGVVPEDPECRKWREAVGKAMTELARASDEVIRLFCGIATVLKYKEN